MKNLLAVSCVLLFLANGAAVASPASGFGTVNANIATGYNYLGYNPSVVSDEKKKSAIEEAMLKNGQIKRLFERIHENIQKQIGKILSIRENNQ